MYIPKSSDSLQAGPRDDCDSVALAMLTRLYDNEGFPEF